MAITTSYDVVGIREDLRDVIYNISPEETPFLSKCKKSKATNTYHEWQTDTLRSSATNAHVEGAATTAAAVTASVRLGNYTQIFKNAVQVADTDEGLNKAGRAKEIAYQTMKIAKEQKLDLEKSLLLNNSRAAGSSSVARELAGAGSWVATNAVGGASFAAATGDGTDAYTAGTARALTQTIFDGVMEDIWEAGGKPNSVYLSAAQMGTALGFTGNNNQRSTIGAADGKVANLIEVYMTPWGSVEFTPSREVANADVFIMQDDMWEVAELRPMKNIALAKTGDNTTRQITTELTLVCKNENASGLIADCS